MVCWRQQYGTRCCGAATVWSMRHKLQRFPTPRCDHKRHRSRVDWAGGFCETLDALGQCWVKATPYQIPHADAGEIYFTTSEPQEHNASSNWLYVVDTPSLFR